MNMNTNTVEGHLNHLFGIYRKDHKLLRTPQGGSVDGLDEVTSERAVGELPEDAKVWFLIAEELREKYESLLRVGAPAEKRTHYQVMIQMASVRIDARVSDVLKLAPGTYVVDSNWGVRVYKELHLRELPVEEDDVVGLLSLAGASAVYRPRKGLAGIGIAHRLFDDDGDDTDDSDDDEEWDDDDGRNHCLNVDQDSLVVGVGGITPCGDPTCPRCGLASPYRQAMEKEAWRMGTL